MSSSIAGFQRQQIYGRPLCGRAVNGRHSPLFFGRIRQAAAMIVALGFGFGLCFGVWNYTAPRPSDQYPDGMTYIGNGIYQMPDGTYTGDIPQGTDTSYWNNVFYPIGYPYGFSGGTMNNPTHYYNAITGAYGSLGGGEELQATAANQEKQIETFAAGLQKMRAQIEVSKRHRKQSPIISKSAGGKRTTTL